MRACYVGENRVAISRPALVSGPPSAAHLVHLLSGKIFNMQVWHGMAWRDSAA